MTVASWEFWSLANMLITTHGDDAENEAARQLHVAEEQNDQGQKVVWTEVIKKLGQLRSERQ